jgi:hypothetical protein
MYQNKGMAKPACLLAIIAGLAACGGGADSKSRSGPNTYKETTAGSGSTVADAETAVSQGTITYANYRLWNTPMTDQAWALPSVIAAVDFNAAAKAGSIKFAAANGNQVISTSDGYATVTWAGPFASGVYQFHGNLLVGCNASAAVATEATEIFVSTSLQRVVGAAPLDDLNGYTFDVLDCSGTQGDTLKFNTDGTLTMSFAKSALSQNQKINLLNPETFGGALVDNKYHGGHVFRFGRNGVTRYAIAMQIATGNFNSRYRYLLAVQR